MSLTSFVNEKDVRERFKAEFVKPVLIRNQTLLAPPKTQNSRLVGTAFDYLMRFHLKKLNPQAVETTWIAEYGLEGMRRRGFRDSYEQGSLIIAQARERYAEFLSTQILTDELVASTLLLAKLDAFYRSQKVDENLQHINEEDVQDLRNLISLVDDNLFRTPGVIYLNPEFEYGSPLVGGADADLIIDDLLIDVKSVKEFSLERRDFNQLVGYYILSRLDELRLAQLQYQIKRLGIYFSRHAYLFIFNVEEVIDKQKLPAFLEWFQLRAGRSF